MGYCDYHTHTTYCDGKSSIEEMILSAIEKKMDTIGILCHSYTFFDESYCIKKENIEKFQNEVRELGKKYKDKITVKCGVEQDLYSSYPTTGFDYVLGSLHYAKVGNEYFALDNSKDDFIKIVKEKYNGDYISLCVDYFNEISNVVEKTNCNIVGHFDLVTKYNEGDILFNTKDERYVDAYKKAVDKIVKNDVLFEINTGAIARGYRSTPYPSNDIISYIKEKGGKFILSSDSHNLNTLSFEFEKWKYLL